MLIPTIAAWVYDAADSPSDNTWMIYVAAIVVSIVAPILGRKFQLRRARNWPTTTGKVESRGVRGVERGHGTVTVGEVAYSYSVNGDYYAGFLLKENATESALEAWTQRFTSGQSVMIRYDPKHPDISVLDERDQVAMMATSAG